MYFDHQHFPLVWMRPAKGAGQPGVEPFQQLEAVSYTHLTLPTKA